MSSVRTNNLPEPPTYPVISNSSTSPQSCVPSGCSGASCVRRRPQVVEVGLPSVVLPAPVACGQAECRPQDHCFSTVVRDGAAFEEARIRAVASREHRSGRFGWRVVLHGRGGHDTSVMAFKAEGAPIDHALLTRQGIALQSQYIVLICACPGGWPASRWGAGSA